MSHQPHPRIPRPALFALVADDILKVRIGLFCQEALDEITRLLGGKSQEDPYLVNVPRIQTDMMLRLSIAVTELQEVVGALRRTGNLARAVQTKEQEI